MPDSHRYVTRHVQECNWLQALEGGFDTSHLSFLHRGDDGRTPTARPIPMPTRYEVMPVDFGFVSGTGRDAARRQQRLDRNVMLMPFHKLISTSPIGAHVWVPIDDEKTMNYCIEYRDGSAAHRRRSAKIRATLSFHPSRAAARQRPRRSLNKDNDYLIDRALQKSGKSYTGIKGIGLQDCGIQESMGPIADRTIEHLGVCDTAIIKLRRLLLQTVKDFERNAQHAASPASTRRLSRALRPLHRAGDDDDGGSGRPLHPHQRADAGQIAMRAAARAALVLAGLLAASPAASAADHLRVGKAVQVGWTFTILEVGVDQGIFAKYNIDPEIIAFAGEAKLMQAFAASAVDLGIGSGPGMVFNAKGSPTIAVAAYAADPRNIAVVVLPELAHQVRARPQRQIAVGVERRLADRMAGAAALGPGRLGPGRRDTGCRE